MLRYVPILVVVACQQNPSTPPTPQSGMPDQIPVVECSSDGDCTDMSCCDEVCVDLAFNRFACDACGTACGDGDACLNGACKGVSFASLCESEGIIRISNGLAPDDQSGGVIASAIAEACGDGPPTAIPQNDGDTTDPSGFPLPGKGEALVVPGGIFVSSVAMAMETSGYTGVYFSGNEVGGGFYDMDSGDPIAQWDAADISPSHDFFALQVSPDPVGSRMVVTAGGAETAGTQAAARWFASQVAADLSSHDRSWYVVEWTNDDDNAQPSDGDIFNVRGQG